MLWFSIFATVLLTLPYEGNTASYHAFMDLSDFITESSITEHFDGCRTFRVITEYQCIILGCRNQIIRLATSNLNTLDKVLWKPDKDKYDTCRQAGKDLSECSNHILTIQLLTKNIIACGTLAYTPTCSKRKIKNIGSISEEFNAVGIIPFNAELNSTCIMTDEGDIYSSLAVDTLGDRPIIHRKSLGGTFPDLSTQATNQIWLKEPQFISSYQIEKFVYFFFLEEMVENSICNVFKGGRVARVCANDAGGHPDKIWTTFNKAKIICVVGDEKFTRLMDTYFDQLSGKVYALFTTYSTYKSSAICTYSAEDLNRAFKSNFLIQSKDPGIWIEKENTLPNFDCQVQPLLSSFPLQTIRGLSDATVDIIMSEAVTPGDKVPILKVDGASWQQVIVDVPIQRLDGDIRVLFVLTETNQLLKYSEGTWGTCLLDTVDLTADRKVLKMELLRDEKQLLILHDRGLLKMDVAFCSLFKTADHCIAAQDPYCGWDSSANKCITLGPDDSDSWNRNVLGCPYNPPVDGGFEPWSQWNQCPYLNDNDGKTCMCHTRRCNNPPPSYDGKHCSGETVEVKDCMVNGGWSEWENWSTCDKSHFRRRFCNNPEPANRGSYCTGSNIESEACTEETESKPMEAISIFDSWSEWSECSAQCGGGSKKRTRKCLDLPESQASCGGGEMIVEDCNTHECPDSVDDLTSPWSTWFVLNFTSSPSRWTELRQRSYVDHGQLIVQNETRHCDKVEFCSGTNYGKIIGWSTWSPWSQCSETCGNGFKARRRECLGNPENCQGNPESVADCNNNCPLELKSKDNVFSCWSEWTHCSSDCGLGSKVRSRSCLDENNDLNGFCQKEYLQELRPCSGGLGKSCSIESVWSEWSVCSLMPIRRKQRHCVDEAINCEEGLEVNLFLCAEGEYKEQTGALRQKSGSAGFSYLLIIGISIGCLLLGVLITIIIIYLLFFFQKIPDKFLKRENVAPIPPQYEQALNLPDPRPPSVYQPTVSHNLYTFDSPIMTPRLLPPFRTGNTLPRNMGRERGDGTDNSPIIMETFKPESSFHNGFYTLDLKEARKKKKASRAKENHRLMDQERDLSDESPCRPPSRQLSNSHQNQAPSSGFVPYYHSNRTSSPNGQIPTRENNYYDQRMLTRASPGYCDMNQNNAEQPPGNMQLPHNEGNRNRVDVVLNTYGTMQRSRQPQQARLTNMTSEI